MDTAAPFEYAWTSVPVGNYQLQAVAVDNLDGRGTRPWSCVCHPAQPPGRAERQPGCWPCEFAP